MKFLTKTNKCENGHIKQELMKGYIGHTEKDYCDYVYRKLQNLRLCQNGITKDLTDRNIYCMKTAMLQAHANNPEEFYHELADFFRGRGNDMELPVTCTEKSVFIMLYETGASIMHRQSMR